MKKIKVVVLCLSASLLALIGIVSLLFLGAVAERIEGKSEAAHANVRPADRPTIKDLQSDIQFESHTCGLHAIRTIYSAYGLAPDEENLRFRLGVDVPANPADQTSTGTLHPDIFRVLEEDRFDYTSLQLNDETLAIEELSKHLEGGHLAMLLISRRENGNMHWVVSGSIEDEDLLIFDPLFEAPYREPISDFVNQCLLSCILIEPSSGKELEAPSNLAEGTKAMLATMDRLNELQKARENQPNPNLK